MDNEERMSQLTPLQLSAPAARPRSLAAALPAVTFVVGSQEYGLPVADVLEIVPMPALLTLAGAPASLVGLLNRRGAYLPVLDSRVLVGEPVQYDLNQYIVIAGRAAGNLQQAAALLGLLVDRVCDVHMFEAESLTPLSSGTAAPFLRGVARCADRSVLLFGLEELLALVPAISREVVPA
jgi:purine-binding chemotaxis protein CheW